MNVYIPLGYLKHPLARTKEYGRISLSVGINMIPIPSKWLCGSSFPTPVRLLEVLKVRFRHFWTWTVIALRVGGIGQL